MNGFLLTRDLLLIPILSILLLSLQCVLMKNKTYVLRYIGYRNFINDLIKHVSLLILVHVRLLFCSNCSLYALPLLKHWIRYYDTVYERDGINYFWSIKNSNEVLNKFKSKNFKDFQIVYIWFFYTTTLPYHLLKINLLIELIERLFGRIPNIWLATKNVLFFTSDVYNNHNLWSCQKVCDALVYLLNNILLSLELNFIGKLLVIRWELLCSSSYRFVSFLLWERFHEVSLTGKSGWHYWGFQFNLYLDGLLNIYNI